MKCRFLYLVGDLHTGGLERQLCYLLQAMDLKRYNPAVAVWSYRGQNIHVPQIEALGIPLYRFPQTLSGPAKLQEFRRLVRELRPEVVHSYSFYTNFAAHWGTLATPAIPLGSVRNDFKLEQENSGWWLGRLSGRWPRNQISNSFSAVKSAREICSQFVPKQIHVVRNGLDLTHFQKSALPTDGPVSILGIGYLMPAKRWDRLLTAARDLKQQGFDYQICIAGDGPLRGALKNQAQNLGVADRTQLIGHSDDIPKWLANSTFLVHVSDGEGYPNAVMEAMASGRATVVTDAGDVPFLVDDGKTGFVVRRGDHATLVERIARLIRNRDLCRSMGEAGRAKAEREFRLDRLVEETLGAYRMSGWHDSQTHVTWQKPSGFIDCEGHSCSPSATRKDCL